MAITKIHAIKTTLNKAINYITNPSKTEGQLYTSSYNCEPITAHLDFKMTDILAKEVIGDYNKNKDSSILAYHLIQSFSTNDNITPEAAHEIGQKLADRFLQGKNEYVIATHVDKGHIHNHIIFNATSFYDYKKFRTVPYKTAKLIREISDKLCLDYGLEVITNPKGKGIKQYEWEQRKAGTSWKAKIEKIIDEAILKANDYKEFYEILKANHVEIKEGKHISFKLSGQERYVRGKTIGEDYTKDNIIKRITDPDKNKSTIKVKTHNNFEKNIYWEARKKMLHETQELANALIVIRRENIESIPDFAHKASELKKYTLSIRDNIKLLDNKNIQYKDVAKYLITYNKYIDIKMNYDKQPFINKKAFYKKHESELIAFEFAEKKLEEIGIDTSVDHNKVLQLISNQDSRTRELVNDIKAVEIRIDDILKSKIVVEKVLGINENNIDKRDKEKRKEEHNL